MTKPSPDDILRERCVAILKEKGKPMDCLLLSRILREDSSAVYRACMSIKGVQLSGMGMLQGFELPA